MPTRSPRALPCESDLAVRVRRYTGRVEFTGESQDHALGELDRLRADRSRAVAVPMGCATLYGQLLQLAEALLVAEARGEALFLAPQLGIGTGWALGLGAFAGMALIPFLMFAVKLTLVALMVGFAALVGYGVYSAF